MVIYGLLRDEVTIPLELPAATLHGPGLTWLVTATR